MKLTPGRQRGGRLMRRGLSPQKKRTPWRRRVGVSEIGLPARRWRWRWPTREKDPPLPCSALFKAEGRGCHGKQEWITVLPLDPSNGPDWRLVKVPGSQPSDTVPVGLTRDPTTWRPVDAGTRPAWLPALWIRALLGGSAPLILIPLSNGWNNKIILGKNKKDTLFIRVFDNSNVEVFTDPLILIPLATRINQKSMIKSMRVTDPTTRGLYLEL